MFSACHDFQSGYNLGAPHLLVSRRTLAMKVVAGFFCLLPALVFAIRPAPSVCLTQGEKPETEKLVYADFEKMENGRPVSNGGGLVQIFTAQESTPAQFKGMANASPGSPDIVVAKGNEKNHVAMFEYTLTAPNQWANVTLEIQ